MNFIENIDQQIFFFINNDCHFDVLNKLMPYWRSMYLWIPLYIFFISYMIENFGKKGLIFLLALSLTIGVADTVSSKLIKKNVERLRPCNNETIKWQVKLLVPCGSGYSFTSSHATNHFAVASFLIFTIVGRRKWLKWSLLAWAGTIALGQVYVGVHYPIDIICGGILGSLIAWGMSILYKKYAQQWAIPPQ